MSQKAIIVCERPGELESQLARILDFFQIPYHTATPGEVWQQSSATAGGRYSLLSTMPAMSEALLQRPTFAGLPPLLERAESLFLFGAETSGPTLVLLRKLTGCSSVGLHEATGPGVKCAISSKHGDVCGPLAGLTVQAVLRRSELAITIPKADCEIESLISGPEGEFFARVQYGGLACYLAPTQRLIDLSEPVEGEYSDIAKHFFSAVPLVMYLKRAFADSLFAPIEHGACLIIDDPVLRPHYGFVNFQQLAADMAQRRAACSIGFIPWNWRRSRSSVVELFKKNPERLSLTIHGCDHTGGEFADTRSNEINARAKGAQVRMERHRRLTGLPHESVMVFPQGKFSAVSPTVLKHNGFVAAVNTTVSPVKESKTEIGETWRTAILKYGDFAVYTRRYVFHGIHNFAFDLLLGKPCLIASHHDDFRNDGRTLLDFIDRLNQLPATLIWRPLGDVIRRAYHQRIGRDGSNELRMFGNEIIIENRNPGPLELTVEKRERDPDGIERIEISGQPVQFASHGEMTRFRLEVPGGDRALVRVSFKDIFGEASYAPPMRQRLRLLARRYLSEFRDESQANAPWIYHYAQSARKLVDRASRRSESADLKRIA